MRKQKMIRWIAWAVAGIACVAGGIHVYQKYQEREAAIRAIEARDQAKSQEEEDLGLAKNTAATRRCGRFSA